MTVLMGSRVVESPGAAGGGWSGGFFSESGAAGAGGAVWACESPPGAGAGLDWAHAGIKNARITKGSFRSACMAEKVYPLRCLLVIAKMLIVLPPTLVAMGKRGFDLLAGMLALYIFEGGIHLAGDLVEFQTAGSGMQR